MTDKSTRLFNERPARVRFLTGLFESVKRRSIVGVIYAFYWLWMAVCLIGPDVEVSLFADTPLRGPSWVVPIVFIAFSNMILALHFRKTRKVLSSSKRFVVLALCMGGAGMLHGVWVIIADDNSMVSLAVYLLSSLSIGVMATLFRIEIDRVFGWLGTQQTLSQVMLGTILAAIIFFIFLQVPSWTALIFAPLLALGASALLGAHTKSYHQTKFYTHGLTVDLPFPAKFMVTSFVQGGAIGIFYGWIYAYGFFPAGSGIYVMSSFAAVVLLFCLLFLMRMSFNRLIYKAAFPVIALGFLLMALIPSMESTGYFIPLLGFCYLDMVLWSLGACLIKNMGLPAPWIACGPGAALYFGNVAGFGIVAIIAHSGWPGSSLMYYLGSLVAFLLLAIALFLSSSHNLKYGWGTVQPGDNPSIPDDVQSTVNYIAADRELTNRETEVFLLIAQGKTRGIICDQLCVSVDTVKTHTRSVYRKLSVHSQMEVIDLVNSERENLRPSDLAEDELE